MTIKDEAGPQTPPAVGEYALEQRASDDCTCYTCGYTWKCGQHGGHSCARVMEVTVADLRARLAKYEDAEGRPVVVDPDPYGWVAAGGFYTDRQAAIEAAGKTPCIEVYSRPQMDASENRSLQRQAVAEELARQLKASGGEIRELRRLNSSPASAPNHSEQVREWIPVSERLPDEREHMRVFAVSALSDAVTIWATSSITRNPDGFAYWMPLPAAPSAGSLEQGE